MEEKYISFKQLSEQLGMDRSHARRYILKLGIKPQKRRTPDSGNQLCLTVTEEQAQEILRQRSDQGFLNTSKVIDTELGVFYVIQLVPELDYRRLKLGFAIDINERLSQHRTAAPTATILQTWPCKRSWETTVTDCLISEGCKLILNEVYECDDLNKLILKGNALFKILPDPKIRIELSENSPFKQKGKRKKDNLILMNKKT